MAGRFDLILLASVSVVIFASVCHASDPRCSAPPYGGTVQEFQSFVKYFGQYVTPTKFLAGICDIKLGGADRTPMYNLGLTDQDIDSKPSADLWVDVLTAIRELAKNTK